MFDFYNYLVLRIVYSSKKNKVRQKEGNTETENQHILVALNLPVEKSIESAEYRFWHI